MKWLVKRQELSLDLMQSRVFACLTSEGTSPVIEWQSSRMSGLLGFSYTVEFGDSQCVCVSFCCGCCPSNPAMRQKEEEAKAKARVMQEQRGEDTGGGGGGDAGGMEGGWGSGGQRHTVVFC